MIEETGRLRIIGERGGTVSEITEFLFDLERAYLALYAFNLQDDLPRRPRRALPIDYLYKFGPLLDPIIGRPALTSESIPPSSRLTIERISIESPGFWEVLASMNPLVQIREYLNDRHKRRQDREFREPAEKERLSLENELIRMQLVEKENSAVHKRIAVLREIGYTNEDIQRHVWLAVGSPLSRLGRHQDNRLIGGAE